MTRGDPGEQFPMVVQQSPALPNAFRRRNPIKIDPKIQPKLRLVSITFDYTFDRRDPGQCNIDRGFGDARLKRFLPKIPEPIRALYFFLRSSTGQSGRISRADGVARAVGGAEAESRAPMEPC